MQKTTLLDFVTKLSSLANFKTQEQPKTQSAQKKPVNQPQKQDDAPILEAQTSQSDKLKPQGDQSIMRSYNPFEQSLKERTQLNMPRAHKPVKDKIDLSLCKNLLPKEGSDGSKNMIELINRHNAFSNKIKGS